MVAELSVLRRVVDIIADAPAPEVIMGISLTDEEMARYEALCEKNEEGTLNSDETEELDTFLFADHFVGMAKAKAYGKLDKKPFLEQV